MLTHRELIDAIPHALHTVNLPGCGERRAGKVRDIYAPPILLGKRVLVATDRVSAFDRVLGVIPFKGQVLNQLSAWWFEQTRDIVANHMVSIPDPNVTIAHEARPLPVEVVVRGYITGVTSTSLWSLYAQGERRPYGIPLPEGLRKNDPLPTPLITPTTKATGGRHDEQLTRDDVLACGLVIEPLWEKIEQVALALFERGQAVAQQAGLVLVDTKYEFGGRRGELLLIDELHTPDSSRFWTQESCAPGREPQNVDKEFLRAWFAEQGYRGEGTPPPMPPDFIAEVAARYIAVYEQLTGTTFQPGAQPAAERIAQALADCGAVR